MDKILQALAPLLERLTFLRVLALGFAIAFGVAGYFGYQQQERIATHFFGEEPAPTFKVVSQRSQQEIQKLMRIRKDIAFISVLKFDFSRNVRVPIFRVFNDEKLRNTVYERLRGGDGALPIFIRDDLTNNNEMIAIIQGESSCEPFKNGGLSRVWPDFVDVLTVSCRVPIPPAYTGSPGGYIAAHMSFKPTPYELEKIKLDLLALAKRIYEIETEKK